MRKLEVMSETNQTEELHHAQTAEQIHNLFSTVADLQQKVLSLENGSKQNVSYNLIGLYNHIQCVPLACSFLEIANNCPQIRGKLVTALQSINVLEQFP